MTRSLILLVPLLLLAFDAHAATMVVEPSLSRVLALGLATLIGGPAGALATRMSGLAPARARSEVGRKRVPPPHHPPVEPIPPAS